MKTKILIVGLGGVGGYYGGLLAEKYAHDPELEINFLVRGEHLKKIQENGLKVITETEEFTCHPHCATDNAVELGFQDYIILSTKSYDLENTLEQIKPCIGAATVILPLLNGADISKRIRAFLPGIEVWEGCVYIVGRLTEPGVVQSTGGLHDFFFGYDTTERNRLNKMYNWLKNAGIEVHLSDDIRMIIWRKFIFISTTATLTSYYNVGFRDVLTDNIRKETTLQYMKEVAALAAAEGIVFEKDIIETTIRHIERLPFGTTSSMHSDFKANRQTELETLTGIVIQLGNNYKVDTPVCRKIYNELKKR
jgi:2-dehydropantoate 2-reductase